MIRRGYGVKTLLTIPAGTIRLLLVEHRPGND